MAECIVYVEVNHFGNIYTQKYQNHPASITQENILNSYEENKLYNVLMDLN